MTMTNYYQEVLRQGNIVRIGIVREYATQTSKVGGGGVFTHIDIYRNKLLRPNNLESRTSEPDYINYIKHILSNNVSDY